MRDVDDEIAGLLEKSRQMAARSRRLSRIAMGFAAAGLLFQLGAIAVRCAS